MLCVALPPQQREHHCELSVGAEERAHIGGTNANNEAPSLFKQWGNWIIRGECREYTVFGYVNFECSINRKHNA